MKECLLKGDIGGFARVMGTSWEAKKRLADSISNHHVDDIHEAAMAAGALAGKVSGAGGGGFMTFLVDPSRRGEVIRALSKQAGRIMTWTFTGQGSKVGRSCKLHDDPAMRDSGRRQGHAPRRPHGHHTQAASALRRPAIPGLGDARDGALRCA